MCTADMTIVHFIDGMHCQYMKMDKLAPSATSCGTVALIFC